MGFWHIGTHRNIQEQELKRRFPKMNRRTGFKGSKDGIECEDEYKTLETNEMYLFVSVGDM